MIAENWRYYGGFQRAAALIEGGAIGRPVQAHWAHYSAIAQGPFFETAWRRNPQHPGGYLSDGGVHHAAAMRGILGEAATVQATATSIRPDLPPLDTLERADHLGFGRRFDLPGELRARWTGDPADDRRNGWGGQGEQGMG